MCAQLFPFFSAWKGLVMVLPEGRRRRRPGVGVRQGELLFLGFHQWGFDEKSWAKATRRTYEITARQAHRWLQTKGRSLFTATLKDLRLFHFALPPHPRTRNNVRQGLIGFGEYLIAREIRGDNPAIGLPRLKEPRNLPKSLSSEEISQILQVLPVFGPMWSAMVSVFAYEGLRLSECLNLSWEQIDPPWLRFDSTKSRRQRDLPLHPEVQSALKKWRQHCSDPVHLFPSPIHPGRIMSVSFVYGYMRDIGRMAGVENLYPHRFRHTFATTMLNENNSDLRTVQEAMGHASPQTTAIYTEVRPARLKAEMDRLQYGRAGT